MMKRFFLIAIMAVACLGAWADGEVSNKTVWTFGDYAGQSAKVYNLNGLYLHSSEENSAFTDFAAVTEHAKTLSGTFTWPTQWEATKILESAKGCDLSALGDIDAASTSGADGSLAFNYSKSGKLYIVYGATTTTDGTFNVMQKTTGETSFTSVLSETMLGINYTGELNAPTRGTSNYTYTQQEAIVSLSGSGTVYLGGSQPYCIYAILYLPDPYGTYDFQTWAEANMTANNQATITLTTDGIMTGEFTPTTGTVNGTMTLNDVFSITGTSYKLRKNGSTGNANSGLMIAKTGGAKLTINRLKAGDWFTITTDVANRLQFATSNANVHPAGSSETITQDNYVQSGTVYIATAATTVDVYSKAVGTVYIHRIQISDEDAVSAPVISVDGSNQVTIDGGTSLKGNPVTVYYTTDDTDPTTSATRQVYSAPFTPTATVKVRAYSVLTSDNTIVSTEATPAVVRVGTWTGEQNVFDFASAANNYVDITFGETAVEGIRYYGGSSSQDNAGNFYPITNTDWMTASEGNTAVVSWREGANNAAFENGGLKWKSQRYFAVSGLTEGQRIKILFDGQLRYRTNVADGAPVVQKDGSVVAAETTYGSSTAKDTEITLTIKSGSYLVFYCNTANDVIKKISVLPAPQNYTLTITQPANGSIYAKVNNETVTSPAEVTSESEVTLVATPDAGYQLEGWKDGDNAAVGAIPQSLVTTMTMPSNNITVTATMTAQPEEAPAITTEKVWTFDSFTADTKLSGAGVYEYEGLYIGGHSATNYSTVTAGTGVTATGISNDVTNYLALAGGYDKDIASTVTANTYKTDAISFKAGTQGVVTAFMSGISSTTQQRYFNIYENGSKHQTAMTDNNPVAISQGVSQAGSVFIATSAGAAKIYAVRFLPEAITAPTVEVTYEGVVTITSGASSLSTNYSDLVALKTYYTTDGSEPSATNGTEYTEPFEPGSCTVKAVTVNTKTGNGSESASQKVVVHIAPSTGVPVIIVAGQSNTDGRIATTETAFPYTLNHTLMSYCNGADYTTEGDFEAYGTTPKSDSGERWGYDAVVYDKIQTQLGGETDFYVIKQSKGNTAVNLLCSGNGQHWWSANPVWLDRNTSANAGGKSLLLALKSHIDKSLKALEDADKEYDIKFLMWHQGEGDRGKQNEYETQMKAVINEIRNYLVTRTGNNKYSNLPIILGGVASVSKEYSEGVETGKQNLAAADANVYYASTGEMTLTDDFRSDEVHFNATGAGKLATSVWNIITTNNLMTGITIAGTNTPAANPLAEDVVSETKTFTFSAAETINDSKSFDGLYLHGVKVLNKGYDDVTFADDTTAPATYAAQSSGADRSASITERLTGGNGAYSRTFGMNVAGEGTFMAVVRGSSTTDRIRLKFNGEEQHAVWVDSADENILLVGKATGSGTFFITNSEGKSFDLLAARFIAGQTDIEIPATPTYTITTVVTDNGTGTLTANAAESPQRETITLTIEPAAGYYLSLLYANQGVVVGENNTFSMPKANVTITATFKPQTAAENDVTTNVSIVDENNATINSIEMGEGTTTVAVSGTVGGAPVTAIADDTFTAENTASLTSVDLSETAVTMSGERSDIDALKNINASTLIYLPSTANVTGTNVVTKSGDDFTCEDYQIVDGKACAAPHSFTAASATLARTFTADKKCTICLPYTIMASGGKFYKFTGISNSKVQMTQQTGTLEANTPYIFVPESNSESISATNVEVSVSNAPQTENTDAGFTFVGTFERLTWEAPIGIYGFAAQERDGAIVGQFVRVGSGASINACRAYLQYTGDETLSDVSNPSNAPRRAAADMPETMDIEWIAAPADNSSTTGVDEVRNKTKEGEEEYFNLNGQRVSTSYKGLIIRNGRKEFKK